MNAPPPDSFFTMQSFTTFSGCAAMVYFVSAALQKSFNFNPKWFALVLSEVIVIVGTYYSHAAQVGSDYILAVINGCVVYSSAIGMAAISGATSERGVDRGLDNARIQRRRYFTQSWY